MKMYIKIVSITIFLYCAQPLHASHTASSPAKLPTTDQLSLPQEFRTKIVPAYNPQKSMGAITIPCSGSYGGDTTPKQYTINKLFIPGTAEDYYARLVQDATDTILELKFVQNAQQVMYTPTAVTLEEEDSGTIVMVAPRAHNQDELKFIWELLKLNHATPNGNLRRWLHLEAINKKPAWDRFTTEEQNAYKESLNGHFLELAGHLRNDGTEADAYKSRFKKSSK